MTLGSELCIPNEGSMMHTEWHSRIATHTSQPKCDENNKDLFFFSLSKFLRWSLMIFIIKGFWTFVFIFIVISTAFQPICPPIWLSNSGTFTELRTTSFIESTCSDSISHNRVQVLSIPWLLLACSQDWICNLQMIVSLEA